MEECSFRVGSGREREMCESNASGNSSRELECSGDDDGIELGVAVVDCGVVVKAGGGDDAIDVRAAALACV